MIVTHVRKITLKKKQPDQPTDDTPTFLYSRTNKVKLLLSVCPNYETRLTSLIMGFSTILQANILSNWYFFIIIHNG